MSTNLATLLTVFFLTIALPQRPAIDEAPVAILKQTHVVVPREQKILQIQARIDLWEGNIMHLFSILTVKFTPFILAIDFI